MTISRRGLLLSLAPLLRAQDTKFSTDVKVVNVLATVRDKHGQIIRNLAKDDFLLEEDGRPQAIRYFAQQSGLPLTLGLLVDTSLSQRRVLDTERRASYNFFEQVLREDKDLAFVIHFDFDVELLQDLTSSRKQLEKALSLLQTPELRRPQGGGRGGPFPQGGGRRRGGGTSLYDAVLLTSDELMRKQSGRKALILLTDGVDTGSKVSLASAVESAERADTLLYGIRFYDEQGYGGGFTGRGMGRRGGPRSRAPVRDLPDGKKVLERLSKDTGGGYFEVSRKQTIERIYGQIEEELRNQYSLGYTSDKAAAPGEYRKIRVTVKQKGLVVQARDGYYVTTS